MLSLNFLYGFLLLAIGIAALNTGTPEGGASLGQTGIFFGGAALICALFAIKNRRHGLMAAGFLAFLALLTGGGRFFSLVRQRDAQLVENQGLLLGAFLLISALYLAATIIRWRRRPLSG